MTSAARGKRAFLRRNGLLFDRYLLPDGRECTGQIPGHMLGEQLSTEERAKALDALRAEEQADTNAVSNENSPEHLAALLDALRNGNISAPMNLLQYLADPRVRPALVEAARNAPNGMAANFFQVLGLAGGPGAKELLRERIEWLSAAAGTWRDDKFFNALAGDLSTASCALLELDREADEAAHAFERLFEHVCAFNRHSAIGTAAGVFDRRVHTNAMEILRRALLGLMTSDDDNFVSALGTLLKLDPKASVARCGSLVRSPGWETYSPVVNRLAENIELPGVREVLTAWVKDTTDVETALYVVDDLRTSLPPGFIEDLVRRALAHERPSLRWRGTQVLAWLDAQHARSLASEALTDEPDPALRRILTERAAGDTDSA